MREKKELYMDQEQGRIVFLTKQDLEYLKDRPPPKKKVEVAPYSPSRYSPHYRGGR